MMRDSYHPDMTEPGDDDERRRRRRLTTEIKTSLRDLRNQLSLLNHRVVGRLELKDVDLDCLELITRDGPLGPTELARRAGLHPATMTGILDRLQRRGLVVRERDPEAADRRAVSVRAVRDRIGEVFRLYAGMSTAMDEICTRYTDAELEVIADFLTRTTDAGKDATAQLT
jgi:DNA-binding MarR family transcriptional regulator